jgi:hypothetical protein
MASKRVQTHFLTELWKLRIQTLIGLSCGVITLGMFVALAFRWPQQVAAAIPVLNIACLFLVGSLISFLLQYGLARWMFRRGLIPYIPTWSFDLRNQLSCERDRGRC